MLLDQIKEQLHLLIYREKRDKHILSKFMTVLLKILLWEINVITKKK